MIMNTNPPQPRHSRGQNKPTLGCGPLAPPHIRAVKKVKGATCSHVLTQGGPRPAPIGNCRATQNRQKSYNVGVPTDWHERHGRVKPTHKGYYIHSRQSHVLRGLGHVRGHRRAAVSMAQSGQPTSDSDADDGQRRAPCRATRRCGTVPPDRRDLVFPPRCCCTLSLLHDARRLRSHEVRDHHMGRT